MNFKKKVDPALALTQRPDRLAGGPNEDTTRP